MVALAGSAGTATATLVLSGAQLPLGSEPFPPFTTGVRIALPLP